MPALASITAKLLILVDAVLGKFVTVTTEVSGANCAINQVSGGLTDCGQAIVNNLETLIYALVKLGSDMLPALGPIVN